jgi:hypothetical protein
VSELLNYLISWRISLGKLSSLAGQEIPVTWETRRFSAGFTIAHHLSIDVFKQFGSTYIFTQSFWETDVNTNLLSVSKSPKQSRKVKIFMLFSFSACYNSGRYHQSCCVCSQTPSSYCSCKCMAGSWRTYWFWVSCYQWFMSDYMTA